MKIKFVRLLLGAASLAFALGITSCFEDRMTSPPPTAAGPST